ncbi:hypothetical protein QA597_09620 [Marinilabiliaceae bacterium ANBcel2]|nr:hypothetical protein [Marinilabiliaceae bacterium ANBcel2]
MIKSLLYKEWIKTRWFLLAIAIAGAIIEIYMFLRVGRSIRLVGAEHIWDVVVNRDQFLFYHIKYFPLAAGIVLGLSQFIPEVIDKRIKLTFHLPLPEKTITSVMTGYGFTVLLALFLIQYVSLLAGIRSLFAFEITVTAALTLLPWFVAGICAYLACVFVCVEPSWRMRIPNFLIGVAIIRTLFISGFPGAYIKMSLFMIAITVMFTLFLWLSVYRLKIGRQ